MKIRHSSDPHIINYILQNLHAYNMEKMSLPCEPVDFICNPRLHAIAAYDDQYQLIGGLVYQLKNQGEIFYGEYFFLNNKTRQNGAGTMVITEAIQWARELRCKKIALYTHTFQA